MSKKMKIWFIIATALVMCGFITLGAVMASINWDFTKLSSKNYETRTYEITEKFENIKITSETAKIEFKPSNDEKYSVECYELENVKHSVEVKDGALTVELINSKKWYQYTGFDFDSPKITVYIPVGEYGSLSVNATTGDVIIPEKFSFSSADISETTGSVTFSASVAKIAKIKTTTGNISINNASFGSLDVSVSTGKVTLSSLECEGDVALTVKTGKTELENVFARNIKSNGTTGKITLKNVIAGEKLTLERSTGDVNLERCDGAEIFIKTSTGDVIGSLLSEKIFFADTNTGDKEVPKTTSGGKCEITTNTGDIKIEIKAN